MMIYVPIFVFSVHVIPLVLDSGVCSPYWIKVMTQYVAVTDAWTMSCIHEWVINKLPTNWHFFRPTKEHQLQLLSSVIMLLTLCFSKLWWTCFALVSVLLVLPASFPFDATGSKTGTIYRVRFTVFYENEICHGHFFLQKFCYFLVLSW